MQKTLSIVIPLYNEAAVVSSLCGRLLPLRTFDHTTVREIIFVDDGSRDGTFDALKRESRADSRIKIISFSRNFGHQLAVTAGLHASSGDAVVIMDGDLQDPPELIDTFVKKWKEGYEIIYAVRTVRQRESLFKMATAKLFYRLLNYLAEIKIPIDSGDFSLLDRRVVDVLKNMPEHARFIRGLRAWTGFRFIGVPFERSPRFAGHTKYSFRKMLNLAFAGILGFSTVPLRFATYCGLVFAGASFLFGTSIFIARFFFDSALFVTGWSSLIVSVFFIGGIQLFIMGILGEYIGMIYKEVQRRPLYVVRERVGFDD